jgi:hypothetical protein
VISPARFTLVKAGARRSIIAVIIPTTTSISTKVKAPGEQRSGVGAGTLGEEEASTVGEEK